MPVTRTKAAGGLAGLSSRLGELGKLGADMEVGIFGKRRHTRGSQPMLAQLLAWHEFGTVHVEKRAPIATYMARVGPREIAARTEAVLPAVLRGEVEPREALVSIGQLAAEGVRKTIRRGLPPPLKGPRASGNTGPPLHDWGQMSRAITVKIDGKVERRI